MFYYFPSFTFEFSINCCLTQGLQARFWRLLTRYFQYQAASDKNGDWTWYIFLLSPTISDLLRNKKTQKWSPLCIKSWSQTWIKWIKLTILNTIQDFWYGSCLNEMEDWREVWSVQGTFLHWHSPFLTWLSGICKCFQSTLYARITSLQFCSEQPYICAPQHAEDQISLIRNITLLICSTWDHHK